VPTRPNFPLPTKDDNLIDTIPYNLTSKMSVYSA
jgi:hypothetical protein